MADIKSTLGRFGFLALLTNEFVSTVVTADNNLLDPGIVYEKILAVPPHYLTRQQKTALMQIMQHIKCKEYNSKGVGEIAGVVKAFQDLRKQDARSSSNIPSVEALREGESLTDGGDRSPMSESLANATIIQYLWTRFVQGLKKVAQEDLAFWSFYMIFIHDLIVLYKLTIPELSDIETVTPAIIDRYLRDTPGADDDITKKINVLTSCGAKMKNVFEQFGIRSVEHYRALLASQ